MSSEPTIPGLTDYQLIGRGGSARVYRAYQPAMDRLVAVKVIDGTSEEIRRRFDRERKVMGRLSRHPRIATILDSGFTDSGEPYLTMPYLKGGSLQDRIDREGPLPWQEAADILTEVAKAIDHGHQQGILHRDIKPGNILIDDQDKPQVTDFGIASLGSAGRQTITQSVSLTPGFSPPEAFDAEPVNEAADVYALAATFVCLVTGHPPFTTGDPEQDKMLSMALRIASEPPPDVSEFGVPDQVAAAIERAMAKATSDRPQTVQAFIAFIREGAEDVKATLTSGSPNRGPTRVTSSPDHAPYWDSKRSSLPLQLTSFIGRDQELAEVSKLMRGARLVSVLGPGGTGKTRLGLRVADEMAQEFAHGARFVPLAHLHEPELLAEHVAGAMDLFELMQGSPQSALEAYLRDKDVLVVLDNCEHLAEPVAALATRLLRTSTSLRVLATSRKPLSVDGEVIYTLRPLDLTSEAARLFVERAEAAKPDFRASEENPIVRQICQRLDGLPLAIELAAARVRFLPLGDIAERLDHRFELLTGGSRTEFPHHETLKTALDWSHNLLSSEQQVVFRRLCVFRGSTSAGLIESFIDDIGSPLQALLALADQSLVQIHEGRFNMLETVREYAQERLSEAGEEEDTNRAHAVLFANLVEVEGKRILTTSQLDSLTRLRDDYDNVRAALAWCFEHEPVVGARMASALGQFWFIRGHSSEGRKWLARALSVTVDGELEAELQIARSHLEWVQADFDQAAESADRALTLARSLDDDLLLGVSLGVMARVRVLQNDYVQAESLLKEAISHLELVNATRWLGDCQQSLGIAARSQSRFDAAAALFKRAKDLFLTSGDIHGASWAMAAEARAIYYAEGNTDNLANGIRSALELAQQVGDRRAVATFKATLAHCLSVSGGPDEETRTTVLQLYRDALPELVEIGDRRRLAEHLGGTVSIIIDLKEPEVGAQVHGAVLQAQRVLEVPEVDRISFTAIEEALQSALGPEWQAVVDRGRQLGIEEAAGMALEILKGGSS